MSLIHTVHTKILFILPLLLISTMTDTNNNKNRNASTLALDIDNECKALGNQVQLAVESLQILQNGLDSSAQQAVLDANKIWYKVIKFITKSNLKMCKELLEERRRIQEELVFLKTEKAIQGVLTDCTKEYYGDEMR
mgnify:CR=1 FL=1